jgi:hypothetical protein
VTRLQDYGPLETTTRPAGVHVFADEASARPVFHRSRAADGAVATDPLPQPKAAVGVVFADPSSRTLTVRLSELEGGYAQALWREGWQALRLAQEAGWPLGGLPWVYADAPGSARRTIHGEPVEGGGLSFHWPVGTPGFAELISRAGLTSIVTMDIVTRRISTVRFLNRNASGQ